MKLLVLQYQVLVIFMAKLNPVTVTLKNKTTITIRTAMKTDAEALLEAGYGYLQESPYLISTLNEFNLTKQQEQAWIRSLNDAPNSLLIVAVYGTKIIGSLDLRGEPRKKVQHNAILGIAIRKEWQGIGLGTALFNTAIDWAKNNGILKNIWLNVHTTNKPAIALYTKIGFTQKGIQENFIEEPDGNFTDNILMGLTL